MSAEASEPTWFATVGPRLVANIRKLGEQTAFYGQSLASTGDAVRRYPGELLRIIAEMGMGSGALAVCAALRGARSVTAIDVSRRAVLTARVNAWRNGVRVRALRALARRRCSGMRFTATR